MRRRQPYWPASLPCEGSGQFRSCHHLQIVGADLPIAAWDSSELNAITYRERGQTRSFDLTKMNEHVTAIVIRLNPAKSAIKIERRHSATHPSASLSLHLLSLGLNHFCIPPKSTAPSGRRYRAFDFRAAPSAIRSNEELCTQTAALMLAWRTGEVANFSMRGFVRLGQFAADTASYRAASGGPRRER